jgi:hypothetical protein
VSDDDRTSWAVLVFPYSAGDVSDQLAETLLRMGIPAAVRFIGLTAGCTFAVVTTNAKQQVVKASGDAGGLITWVPVPRDVFVSNMRALAAGVVTLGGTPIEGIPVGPASPRPLDDVAATIDAIAWTSEMSDPELTRLATKVNTALFVVECAGYGRVIAATDAPRGFGGGAWTSHEGLAVYRGGGEYGAALVADGEVHALTWSPPWKMVDPTLPGQVDIDGDVFADEFDRLFPRNLKSDLTPWIERFSLDDTAQASVRDALDKEPGAEPLREFVRILGGPPELIDVLEAGPAERQEMPHRTLDAVDTSSASAANGPPTRSLLSSWTYLVGLIACLIGLTITGPSVISALGGGDVSVFLVLAVAAFAIGGTLNGALLVVSLITRRRPPRPAV